MALRSAPMVTFYPPWWATKWHLDSDGRGCSDRFGSASRGPAQDSTPLPSAQAPNSIALPNRPKLLGGGKLGTTLFQSCYQAANSSLSSGQVGFARCQLGVQDTPLFNDLVALEGETAHLAPQFRLYILAGENRLGKGPPACQGQEEQACANGYVEVEPVLGAAHVFMTAKIALPKLIDWLGLNIREV